MNPLKGQRLIPRLLRHLPQQKALTLLTLLIATYSQLDVVARAAPPPSADMSLMSKAPRDARAQREAETDNFLHCVVPGMDIIINQCPLSLISGLLGVCAQRMKVGAVARTRVSHDRFSVESSRIELSIAWCRFVHRAAVSRKATHQCPRRRRSDPAGAPARRQGD